MHSNPPILSGFGLGLRQPHYELAARGQMKADWFEILSENFMEAHPGHLELLRDVRAHYHYNYHYFRFYSCISHNYLDNVYFSINSSYITCEGIRNAGYF